MFRTNPEGEYDRFFDANGNGIQANIENATNFFGVDLAALRSQLGALQSAQPLAWSTILSNSAETHTARMIRYDMQQHNFPNEPNLGGKMADAGYTGYQTVGENIYAFADDALHGHAGFIIDWGYDDSDRLANNQLIPNWQTNGDGIQDPPGHRNTLINPLMSEIGIGVTRDTDPSTSLGEWIITQHLGHRFAYTPQMLGVVIDDADGDDFYDIGEGLGGVTVTAVGTAGTFTTTSWASGGWQMEVPDGNYTVTFSGGGLAASIVKSATMNGGNIKIDAIQNMSGDPYLGTNGPDVITGSAGGETLTGLGGADILSGLGGNDILLGGSGNDRLEGGVGADTINGGSGVDTASFLTAGSGVTANLTTGRGTAGNANGDTYTSIENLTGSNFADTLIGSSLNNTLQGGRGNDVLRGAAGHDRIEGGIGSDTIDGGSGVDTATFLTAGSGVVANLTTRRGTAGNANGDTYTSIENLVGSNHADTLTGSSGNNYIEGGRGHDILRGAAGADRFEGGIGADTIDGGSGVDTATFITAGSGVVANLTTGRGTAGNANGDTYTSIENLVGSNFADTLTGSSLSNVIEGGRGHDVLLGAAGNDRIEGGVGADNINGGSGSDTATFLTAGSGVVANLTTGRGTAGNANGDTYTSIENLVGSNFADTLTGSSLNNVIEGGRGHDVLLGAAGNDRIEGGIGADNINGGSGSDSAAFATAASGVTLNLTSGVGTRGNANGDTYTSIENVIGSDFDDVVTGVGR